MLGPKHDPSSALDLMSGSEEELEEKLKDYDHIHIGQVRALRGLRKDVQC